MEEVRIYTDGSARSNPEGPGGYGTILHYVDKKGELHVREYSAGYKKTTNNRKYRTGCNTLFQTFTHIVNR